MSDSYLVLWAADRWKALKRNKEAGRPLEVLYGGGHTSTPSFTSHGVVPGDHVYVGMANDGSLHLLARMKVRTIATVEEYLRDHLQAVPADTRLHLWDLETKLAEERPDLGHRLPYGCINEAIIGTEGTPFCFNRPVPIDVLERLRFLNRRGKERGILLEDGKFRASTALGHVLRLVEESAQDFARIVDGA